MLKLNKQQQQQTHTHTHTNTIIVIIGEVWITCTQMEWRNKITHWKILKETDWWQSLTVLLSQCMRLINVIKCLHQKPGVYIFLLHLTYGDPKMVFKLNEPLKEWFYQCHPPMSFHGLTGFRSKVSCILVHHALSITPCLLVLHLFCYISIW